MQTMRCGLKRLVFALAATTVSVIVLYQLFQHAQRPTLFVRYQREGGRQLLDHRVHMEHALQNCSCYMNYIKNHSADGKLSLNSSARTTSRTDVPAQNRTANETSSGDVLEESDTAKVAPPPAPIEPAEKTSEPKDERTALYLQEPIDKHHFGYIHNPQRICFHENGTKMDVYLIFFVPSAPGNFELREAIRRSYGKRDTWPALDGAKVVTVFLLGFTRDRGIQDRIESESREYGDIVQEAFEDSYLNLTRKTVMGLKWVTNHCRHAQFAMKIDDDTTVIQRRILHILEKAPRHNYVIGYVFGTPIVDRNKRSKFYMSKEYYPDDHFPAYTIGAGYIMSTDVVEATFNVAITIPMFPWEDVFVGMCFHKIGVELIHDGGFLFRDAYRHLLTADVETVVGKYASVTSVDKSNMVRLYERFVVKNS